MYIEAQLAHRPIPSIAPRTDPDILDIAGDRFHLATPEDIAAFETVVGNGVMPYLNSHGLSLIVDEDFASRKVKKIDANSITLQEILGWMNARYVRNDYLVTLDQRIVLLTAWKSRTSDESIPQRVIQVDFMYYRDWLDPDKEPRDSYQEKHSLGETEVNGLQTEARSFLKKMKALSQAVDEDCIIQLFPADKQRERLFRRLFNKQSNVRYVSDYI
jgi:hypothetical protein